MRESGKVSREGQTLTECLTRIGCRSACATEAAFSGREPKSALLSLDREPTPARVVVRCRPVFLCE